jgi:hypothetical protein
MSAAIELNYRAATLEQEVYEAIIKKAEAGRRV